MKKLLFIFLLIPALAMAADQVNYKDAVVITTLKKVEVRPAVTETVTPASEDEKTPAVTKEVEPAVYEMALNLPCRIYGEMVMMNGQDITYSYRNRLDLEGREVMVLLDAKIDEMKKIEAMPGYIGQEWAQIKADPRYRANYSVTKADVLATETIDSKTQAVTKVTYKEADAAEPVPMYIGMCKAPLKVEKLSEISKVESAKE